MAIEARRWLMTAVSAPLTRAAFTADPGPGEVVVAVAGCGVCHTDLGYLYDGVRTNHALPLALGHEISGRVVAAGAGAERWIGKAIIVPAVLPCGECDLCKRGLGSDLPRAKDAGQRYPGRVRDAHRRPRPRAVRGRRIAPRPSSNSRSPTFRSSPTRSPRRTRQCVARASSRAASPSSSARAVSAAIACRWRTRSARRSSPSTSTRTSSRRSRTMAPR